MTKFKVGDKVIGNTKANKYSITSCGWIGTVKSVIDDKQMLVEGVSPYINCKVSVVVDIDCFNPYKSVMKIGQTVLNVSYGVGRITGYTLGSPDDDVIYVVDFNDIGTRQMKDHQLTPVTIPKISFKNATSIKVNIDSKLYEEKFLEAFNEYIKKEIPKMNLQFDVRETNRIDKTCNKQIPTMTTTVKLYPFTGKAVCDKEEFDRRQGVLEAIANAVCGGNFDREYNKIIAAEKKAYAQSCKCKTCGKSYETPEQARECEQAHIERKKAKHEKYLMQKAAKKLAREMKVEQMAKEILADEGKEK